MAFCTRSCISTILVSVLAVYPATTTSAGPRHELRALLRLRHGEYASYVNTGPEASERVLLHRLMFHSHNIGNVRRMLDSILTKRRGWTISVVERGQRIEYERPRESVEYLSEAQYNFVERGINNPAWYAEGKPPPKAYRGGCVVQYFQTRR